MNKDYLRYKILDIDPNKKIFYKTNKYVDNFILTTNDNIKESWDIRTFKFTVSKIEEIITENKYLYNNLIHFKDKDDVTIKTIVDDYYLKVKDVVLYGLLINPNIKELNFEEIDKNDINIYFNSHGFKKLILNGEKIGKSIFKKVFGHLIDRYDFEVIDCSHSILKEIYPEKYVTFSEKEKEDFIKFLNQ